jgi:hypothetical protein
MIRSNKWRIASKVCLLLVFFGFFMPVSCDKSGFEVIELGFEYSNDNRLLGPALGLLLLLAATLTSVGIGVALCFKNLPKIADWILWSLGTLGIVIALIAGSDFEWESGVYWILFWQIFALGFLCIPESFAFSQISIESIKTPKIDKEKSRKISKGLPQILQRGKDNKRLLWIVFGIVLVLALLFATLPWHYLIVDAPDGEFVIPKKSWGFSYTFLTDNDVRDMLSNYNNAGWGRQSSFLNNPIYVTMVELGLIVRDGGERICMPTSEKSRKKMLDEMADAAREWWLLEQSYFGETGKIGNFKRIGFRPPGKDEPSATSKTSCWRYQSLKTGFQVSSRATIVDCPNGATWTLSAEKKDSVLNLKINTPMDDDCDDAFYEFYSFENAVLYGRPNEKEAYLESVSPALGTWEKLQQAYYAETKMIGTFQEISYVPAGAPSGEAKHGYGSIRDWIFLPSPNGIKFLNKATVEKCGPGAEWSLTAVPDTVGDSLKIVYREPQACKGAFPELSEKFSNHLTHP